MNAFSHSLDVMMFAWPKAIVAAAIFLTLLYRPERIAHRGAFKMGCILFAFSLLTPSLIAMAFPSSLGERPTILPVWEMALVRLVGFVHPLAFTLAFLLLIYSLQPRAAGTADVVP
jgi:hypothetical protein